MIAISGISRAILITGLVVSQKMARLIYNKEIIQSLFMGRESRKNVLDRDDGIKKALKVR